MKTKNNNWKAALKSLATAIGFALIGLTVNAQMSSYFENAGNNTMAMITEKTVTSAFATTVNTKALATTDVFAIYLETETEEPLQLEDWMTKESTFESGFIRLETETEEELQVENWMMDENRFNGTEKEIKESKSIQKVIAAKNYVFSEETDEGKLRIEGWMLNPKVWKTR
jgi:hypothetical protein